MISFKETHYPKDVILYAVFFYLRYGVSYRDFEEILEEQGVTVDHETLNRWVIRYSPAIALKLNLKNEKQVNPDAWMRPISKGNGCIYTEPLINTVIRLTSCYLSFVTKKLQRLFFKQAINQNEFSDKVVMDKSGVCTLV